MRNKKERQFHISGLGVLLAFTVFAFSILLVLLAGAKVYAGLTEQTRENHAQRTAAQYLATRLRQGNGVYAEDFGGVDALVFPEDIGGSTYITRIYCHDGWLRELYTAKGGEFSPADGEKILEMEELFVIIEENRVTVTFTLPGGQPQQVLGSIPGEVAP